MKSMGERATGERLERMRASALWAGEAFRNRAPIAPGLRDPAAKMPSLTDFLCGGTRRVPTGSPFHQRHYEMKLMDFFVRLGADPQSHWQCGKGMQRRMTEKDAISCSGFGETDY